MLTTRQTDDRPFVGCRRAWLAVCRQAPPGGKTCEEFQAAAKDHAVLGQLAIGTPSTVLTASTAVKYISLGGWPSVIVTQQQSSRPTGSH